VHCDGRERPDLGLASTGRLGVAFEVVVKGGLFVWAIDEVLRGVHPWRRSLGPVLLAYALTSRIFPRNARQWRPFSLQTSNLRPRRPNLSIVSGGYLENSDREKRRAAVLAIKAADYERKRFA
jgi:hypothetical protein